jgi:protein phosphatase
MSEASLPEPESLEAVCAQLEAQPAMPPETPTETQTAASSQAAVLDAEGDGVAQTLPPEEPLSSDPVQDASDAPSLEFYARPPGEPVAPPPIIIEPVAAQSFQSPQPQPLRMMVSALTDMGCVRTNNEDFFGYHEGHGIFVVCDGMGGMASGEVASSRAVTALITCFMETARSGNSVSARLLHAIQEANRDVWEYGQLPQHKGMGTTAVAAAVDGNKLIVGNVGDSRAYILRQGQCTQLTVDHSYINELIRNGTLTVENAHNADLQGMESVICRAVGVAAEIEPDFYSVDLEPGTTVLITTDGLTRYLMQDEIAAVIGSSTIQTACFNLIQVAKQRGGIDNITCMILYVLPN